MTRDTVIVFARVPRLGTVKRRLAQGVGERAALRFHVATLARLLIALRRERRFHVVLAQTPDRARARWPGPRVTARAVKARPAPATVSPVPILWEPARPVRPSTAEAWAMPESAMSAEAPEGLVPADATPPGRSAVTRIGQGGGDLGRRMHRAFARHGRRRVALVGSDIPGLGAADLRACFRALGTAQAAFGPAEDGGYWLVAMGPRRPSRPFAGVRWSTGHALADTLARFAGRKLALLRHLRDVDTAADLLALQG